MSSSESSEDEEEAIKISQAVITNDFLTSILPPSSVGCPIKQLSNGTAQKKKKEEVNIPLKSNRPDKSKNEDEQDSPHAYLLKTTPEFRAYIEKHLSQSLDREINANLLKGFWEKKSAAKREWKEKGIKLFSNDKKLCLGEDDKMDQMLPRSPPKIRARKHKLDSCSESSEEEKITSCIFTVDDILHENRLLGDLSKPGVQPASQDEDQPEVKKSSVDNGDQLVSPVKKKRKTQDLKSKCEHVMSDSVGEDQFEAKLKKKKKKKKMSNAEKEEGVS